MGDTTFTKTDFKTVYEKLRKTRKEETHPISGVELKSFVEKSMKLISKIDFASVDIKSKLFFQRSLLKITIL